MPFFVPFYKNRKKTKKADLIVINFSNLLCSQIERIFYNLDMENWISILISSIIVDLLISLLMKNVFRLKMGNIMIVFMQILFAVTTAVYLFCHISLFLYIVIKLFAGFIFCLLSSEVVKIKILLAQFLSYTALMFSVYGFSEFLIMFFKIVLSEAFRINLSPVYDFLIVFSIFCYFFALFYIFSFFNKISSTKKYLTKVSFSIFGKHIKITGLFDSGNSLYDTKSKKPVMVVSVDALKSVVSKEMLKRMRLGDFSTAAISHQIKFVSIGNTKANMPIVDVGNVVIHKKTGDEIRSCVVGLVSQAFDKSGSFDALLHREFEWRRCDA